MARWRPLLLAIAALGVFAVVFVVAGSGGWGAPAANEQEIGASSRWCERVSGGFLREPVNTLGNLGFVVAGLAMFEVLARDEASRRPRANQFIGHTPVALLYAAAVLFLGPGSMVMHGAHTRFGAWVDNVSMVAFILVPWLVNIAALGRWRRRAFFITYVSVLAVYSAGYWFIGPQLGVGLYLFGVSLGIWAISEFLYRFWSPWLRALSGFLGFAVAAVFGITPAEVLSSPGEYWWVVLFWLPGALATHAAPGRRSYAPWFWAGIAAFGLAYAIWLTGRPDHPWCAPDSVVQPHAIWHLLSAVAAWCFFVFLRTERPAPAPA